MSADGMAWDDQQKAAFYLVEAGSNVHVTGGPGTGKTTVAVEVMRRALEGAHRSSQWAPALMLTPDRHRAVEAEGALAKVGTGRTLTGLSAAGSHRLVRSLSSYAYLVIALWMVERETPLERPTMLSGAKEDAWLKEALAQGCAEFSQEVSGSEAFRMEIRNLMARAGQMGLLPSDLVRLGEVVGLPLWQVAGRMYGQYAGWDDAFVVATAHLDAARIPRVAANLLRDWEIDAAGLGVLAGPPLPALVVVEDAQDMPQSALPLVGALEEAGVQVVITSSADEAVASYRGGVATMGAQLAERVDAQPVVLFTNHRSGRAVQKVVAGMQRWFAPPRKVAAEEGSGAGESAPSKKVEKKKGRLPGVFSTQAQQNAAVVQALREAHLHGHIPWDQMAVVVRHAASVESFQDFLVRASVPIRSGERPVVLSRVPICAATLALVAPERELSGVLEEENALALIASPLVRGDSLGTYRVLRDFRLGDTDRRNRGVVDLLASIGDGGYSPSNRGLYPTYERLRVAAKLWALREDARRASATDGLWMVWDGAGLGQELRGQALKPGFAGMYAAEELDAMLALFRKADLWSQERMDQGLADGTAADFAGEILKQSVVTDSLVPRGLADPGVSVVTPAQAAGREWEAVVVADLQEGSWPSPARAGLGALSRLEGIVEDATARGWPTEGPVAPYLPDRGALVGADGGTEARDRRKEEASLLYVAVSRAKQSLRLFSVSNEDHAPSSFLLALNEEGLLEVPIPGDGEWEHYLTLDSLVAAARRELVSEDSSESGSRDAARLLALLSAAGVPDAHPQNWASTGSVSTDSPILEQGPLRLSPSKLGEAKDCGLRWFLGSVGGNAQDLQEDEADLNAARLGSLVHRVAEENPRGTPQELREAVRKLWAEIGLGEETMWQRRALRDVEEKVARLGTYTAAYKGELQVEQRIRFEVEGAVIHGRADRIEIAPDGSARVVDIKTGSVGTKAQAEDNAQLSAYQIGVAEAGWTPGGAALLGLGLKRDMLREQSPMDPTVLEETRREIGALAKSLSGSRVEANPVTGSCRTCEFQIVCPAKPISERTYE